MLPLRLLMLLVVVSSVHSGFLSNIKNIIVVMMENRSFDHFLGHLKSQNPNIDGLDGKQNNPIDPLDPSKGSMDINNRAVDGGPFDPHHDFDSISQQVYGFVKQMTDKTSPVKMDGFVANAIAAKGMIGAEFAMSTFNSTNLPIMSKLAMEYAIFDHWHCSCPCPTNPNREFLMSGTSHGMVENSIPDAGFPQETHFKFLERHNVSWKIYYNDDPWMAATFSDLRTAESLKNIQEMPAFYNDLASGTLPQYTLIQPKMATSKKTGPSNWQHPDSSVSQGEIFYRDIYEALRNSTHWEDTLLIITYDEHGGFYDHQPTPTDGVPAPDSVLGSNGFDYTRIGVRIPTIMVSPWIPKGTLVGAPSADQKPFATSQFEATSIIATANRIFGITETMTKRDAWAATFQDVVSGDVMRTDCLTTLPGARPLTANELSVECDIMLNDHHLDSLNLLCHLSAHSHAACSEYSHPMEQLQLIDALVLDGQQADPNNWRHVPAPLVAGEWVHTAAYPHLHAPVASRMRQKHFEEASVTMYAAFKQSVGSV